MVNHENKENFSTIFEHLKNKFSFDPKYAVIDFEKSQIEAIGESFPQSKIIILMITKLLNINTLS